MNQSQRVCVVCKKSFISLNNRGKNKKYCSEECSKVASNNRYSCICIGCGNEFKSATTNVKYCSDACRNTDLVVKKCAICDKEFKTPRITETSRKYCSEECSKVAWNSRYSCVCTVCNKEFKASTTTTKYCSDVCRNADLVLLKCAFCNKDFEVNKAVKNYRKFCSIECGKNALKNTRYDRVCEACNKEFKSSTPTARYCSNDCRYKRITIKCQRCTNDFELSHCYRNQKKNCPKCMAITKSKAKTGKLTQRQRAEQIRNAIEEDVRVIVTQLITDLRSTGTSLNGYLVDYYNKPFTESIRTKVLQRDNYTCRVCGKDTDLHVHHRIKRKNGGDHSLKNLITLCCSCHRAIETGYLTYALRKCTKNAFENRHIPVAKDKKKLNKMEEKAILRANLQEIFKLFTNDEKEEALVLLDQVIEKL